jgi:hypothetical protein
MPLGEPMERIEIRRESELQRCLRIYRNDSLIAWHLGLSKDAVAKARLKLKPQRVNGGWVNAKPLDAKEYDKRRERAKAANPRFVAALRKVQQAKG